MKHTMILAALCLSASAAIAAPPVEPMTQMKEWTPAERERSAAVGAEMRRLAEAGRLDEHAALMEAGRQYPDAPAAFVIETGRELHRLGKRRDEPDGVVGGRPFDRLDGLRKTSREFPPGADDRAASIPRATGVHPFRRWDVMADLAAWAAEEQDTHRRVRIRNVRRAVGPITQPIVYPPFFWLPLDMVESEIEAMDPTIKRDIENGIGRHSEILLGGLNIRVYPDDCCAHEATLVVALSHGGQVERYPLRMRLGDDGAYHVADPAGTAVELTGIVATLPEYPVLTIVALEGTEHPAGYRQPIPYVVRWRHFDLEYGAHSPGDPEGVVR